MGMGDDQSIRAPDHTRTATTAAIMDVYQTATPLGHAAFQSRIHLL
jgi:hypothetical protein